MSKNPSLNNRFSVLDINQDHIEDADSNDDGDDKIDIEGDVSTYYLTEDDIYDSVDTVLSKDTHGDDIVSVGTSDQQGKCTRVLDLSTLKLDEIRRRYHIYYKSDPQQFDRAMMDALWDSWLSTIPMFPASMNPKLMHIRRFITDPSKTILIIPDRSPKHRFEYHQLCAALKLDHVSLEPDDDKTVNEIKNMNENGVIEQAGYNKKKPRYDIHSANGSNGYHKGDGYKNFNKNRYRDLSGSHNSNGSRNRHQYKNEGTLEEKKQVIKTMVITKPDDWCWEFTQITDEQKKLNDVHMREAGKKHREWIKFMKTKRCDRCNASAAQYELFTTKQDKSDLICERCVKKDTYAGFKFRHAYGRPFY